MLKIEDSKSNFNNINNNNGVINNTIVSINDEEENDIKSDKVIK